MPYLITLPHKSFVHMGLFLTFLPFTLILPLMKSCSLELISYKFGIRTKSTKIPSFATLYSPTCGLVTGSQAPCPFILCSYFILLHSYFILYLLIFLPHKVPPFLITFEMLRRSCQVHNTSKFSHFLCRRGHRQVGKKCRAARQN